MSWYSFEERENIRDFWKALQILGDYIEYIYQLLRDIENLDKPSFLRP